MTVSEASHDEEERPERFRNPRVDPGTEAFLYVCYLNMYFGRFKTMIENKKVSPTCFVVLTTNWFLLLTYFLFVLTQTGRD